MMTAAGPSFTGTWKLNLAKSQLAGQTVTIERKASGLVHLDSEGLIYDFDLTGKEYPTPDGGTIAWKAVNDNTWDATYRLSGKEIATFHLVVDGNHATFLWKGHRPDGSPVEQTATLTRIAGGPGVFGKWSQSNVTGTATTVEILLEGRDGITFTLVEQQLTCKGRIDGKEYVVKGPGGDLKETFAFTRKGPNSLKLDTKLDGKPFYTDTLILSADGKTMVDEGNAVSVNEPVKAVYDRQ
jgi:hypothetical protein